MFLPSKHPPKLSPIVPPRTLQAYAINISGKSVKRLSFCVLAFKANTLLPWSLLVLITIGRQLDQVPDRFILMALEQLL